MKAKINNKWAKVKERNFNSKKYLGGITFLPYQFALGFGFRMWCTGPAFRFYAGPFKFWLTRFKK